MLHLLAIICWLARTKDCHCIIFHLWDDVVLALCVAHVHCLFQTQCWGHPRVFLNLEVPAASGQPANIPWIPLVISMPVCTCWALAGIWILPATPDKALLPSCVTVTVVQPSFLKANVLWVQVAGLSLNSQPPELFSLLFSFFDQRSWLC